MEPEDDLPEMPGADDAMWWNFMMQQMGKNGKGRGEGPEAGSAAAFYAGAGENPQAPPAEKWDASQWEGGGYGWEFGNGYGMEDDGSKNRTRRRNKKK